MIAAAELGIVCLAFFGFLLILAIVIEVGMVVFAIVAFPSALLILLPIDLLLYPIVKEKFPLIRYIIAITFGDGGPLLHQGVLVVPHSNINEVIKRKKKEFWEKRDKKKRLAYEAKLMSERIFCDICGEAYHNLSALEIHIIMRHKKELEI